MNSALTRKMNKQDAQEWAAWFKATTMLAPFKEVLLSTVEDSLEESDNITIYQSPAAAQELAYRAGYRAGLREAIKLLTYRA